MESQNTARKIFEDRFAELLRTSGLGPRGLERLTGVGKSTISCWKKGRHLPQTLSQMLKVVKAANPDANALEWKKLTVQAWEERDTPPFPARGRAGSATHGRERESDRRSLKLATTDRVYQTLSELKRLRRDPNQQRELGILQAELLAEDPEQVAAVEAECPRDEEGSQIWRGEWGQLIQRLEVEALHISDTDLRERIKEACEIMECHEEPFKQAHQPESRTRHIAAKHAMKSIEAFCDGDPLPDPPKEYVVTRDFVLDFIAEREASRH